jgi:hypothetical protein
VFKTCITISVLFLSTGYEKQNSDNLNILSRCL